MKRFLLFIFIIFTFNIFVFSVEWNKTPDKLLESMKNDVQDTKLGDVEWEGVKGVTGTLYNIKNNGISGYIEWMGFIGLSIAFLLIIYNGIVILSNFSGEDKLAKAKKRFVSLILGVVIVTSGYLIIKLVVSLIGEVFK